MLTDPYFPHCQDVACPLIFTRVLGQVRIRFSVVRGSANVHQFCQSSRRISFALDRSSILTIILITEYRRSIDVRRLGLSHSFASTRNRTPWCSKCISKRFASKGSKVPNLTNTSSKGVPLLPFCCPHILVAPSSTSPLGTFTLVSWGSHLMCPQEC